MQQQLALLLADGCMWLLFLNNSVVPQEILGDSKFRLLSFIFCNVCIFWHRRAGFWFGKRGFLLILILCTLHLLVSGFPAGF